MYIYVGTYVHLGTIFPKIGKLGIQSAIRLFPIFTFSRIEDVSAFVQLTEEG